MNPTILRLSAQSLLGRRRGLVLLVIPVVLVGLMAVIRALTDPGVAYGEVVGDLGLTLAVPLVGLLAATAVLGPEVDDGSVVYLLAKPVRRSSIVLSKYAVALATTLVAGALPLLIAGLVSDSGDVRRALAMLTAGAVASVVYVALFLALCALTRHAVVVGLLLVFFWEGLLGGLLSGIRWVSVGAWADQIAAAVSPAQALASADEVGVGYALIASAVVVAAGLAVATRALQTFSLTGET